MNSIDLTPDLLTLVRNVKAANGARDDLHASILRTRERIGFREWEDCVYHHIFNPDNSVRDEALRHLEAHLAAEDAAAKLSHAILVRLGLA